jgi:NAD(P)H dehydrogenase (quinone)
MSIAVTGATGAFGRLAIEALLHRGIPSGQLVAVGRRVDTIADLAAQGVEVRRADYDDPDTLRAAFAGVDRLLFVSGSEVGRRVPQHLAVIAAAKEAGIGLLAYTSIVNATTADIMLAREHADTERALIESGLTHVLLRNGWYLENYNLASAVEHGLAGAAGDGRISAATRADLAEAAAAVVVGHGYGDKVYELGGEPFTLTELAAAISRQSGRKVAYTNLSEQKYRDFLVAVGVPENLAAALADADRGAGEGQLYVDGHDLEKLIGRPVTPLDEAVRVALGGPAVVSTS